MGGQVGDYNATLRPPIDQLKLNWTRLSGSFGAEFGKNLYLEVIL